MKRIFFLTAAVLLFAAGFLSSCKDDDNDQHSVVAVKNVKIIRSALNVSLGDEGKPGTSVLTYSLEPAGATDIESVVWSSSNPGAATVSQTGLITSVALGETTITITIRVTDGKTFSDQCAVTVVPAPIPVTGVKFEKEEVTLPPGSSIALVAVVLPEDASDKSLYWESNNENVATVSQNGVVTGVALGTAVITVTTNDGQEKTRCTVIVRIDVTGVELTEKGKLELEAGDEVELTARVLPEDATNTKVVWESSNPAAATVDQQGNVKATGIGTTTITVTTEESEFTDSREIEVVHTSLRGVSLGEDFSLQVFEQINQDRALSVTFDPANATNKNISWVSNNSAVVEVNESGRITFKSTGTATITVTAEEGGLQDNIVITVAYYVPLSRTGWSIVGYDATHNDKNAGGSGWSSQASNEGGVASPNGRITAILDDDDAVFWHSSYSNPTLDYPHWFIVDLGEEIEFDAVMLRRRTGNGGTATGYSVFTSDKSNPDTSDPEDGYDWETGGKYTFNPATNDRQAKVLDDAPATARYVKLYFGTEHKGSGNNAMFSQFGLYKKKE